jgi:hypothetical protein
MDYELEKLKQEYTAFTVLWNKVKSEWIQPSDWEDLYRVYPYLTTTAAIARKYSVWDKDLDFAVKVIEPIAVGEVDTSIFFYCDEKSFFNGRAIDLPLSKVASVFLHQSEFCYMDNRKSDGVMSSQVSIYIYARSDILCKSCSLANSGEYKENGQNLKQRTASVSYPDCTCGYYIDIDSYLVSINKIIKKLQK